MSLTWIPYTFNISEPNLAGIVVSINIFISSCVCLRPGHFSTVKSAEFRRDLLGEEGDCQR